MIFANAMSMRPLRQFLPERAYLITARCFEERFFLEPDSEAIAVIVASCLAQAVEKYSLELFAYVVMSNHVHLVVRAPKGGLPEAMQLFFSQVARRVNMLRGRTGPVFSDRYHHQTICDDRALRNAIRYVLLNPVRAGAALSSNSWRGLSSFDDTCRDQILVCTRHARGADVAWSTRRVARNTLRHSRTLEEGKADELLLACHRAVLGPEPAGVQLHDEFVRSLMAEDLERRKAVPNATRKPALPHERPTFSKRSRAPSCIASTSRARVEYLKERRAFVAAYREASARFRRGESACFPPGCCLPWPQLHRLTGCSDTS